MPRRPRPARHEAPKPKSSTDKIIEKASKRARHDDSQEEVEEVEDEEQLLGEDEDDLGEASDYEDADAPRVVRWVGDSDVEENEEEEESADDNEGPSQLKHIQSDLSGLPLGALRRAQNVLRQTEDTSSSEDEAESDNEEGTDDESISEDEQEEKEEEDDKKPEWSIKPRTDITKRRNKHAPTEVTSKRPVTRRRTVVEVKKMEARDPRFLPTAGEYSAAKFQQNYGFLAESHKTELVTLRENLKRARKMLSSSPRNLRYEHEKEVERLERAVKRAESMVNKDKMEQVQMEALRKAAKEEKEKRTQGKREWHMKQKDKRELLMKARYEALAAEGGKRAVKKAIEKKQKKVSQKEKRSRPYGRGEEEEGRRSTGGDWKRRRVG